MRTKYLLLWLVLGSMIALASLASCALLYQGPSSEELLGQLGIDEEYFSKLPTCEQVRLSSYLGPYFPGVHSLAAKPFPHIWMREIFAKKGPEVAQCVINEANERLSNNKDPMNKWRVLTLNILIEELQFDFLASDGRRGADFNFPEAQAYLHTVVCSQTASLQREATHAFYMSRFRSFPRDAFNPPSEAETTQGIEKMKGMLCK